VDFELNIERIMFNTSQVITSFFPRVGFRQGTNTGYNIVDEANQVSDSGLYFQDANALVTIPAIKDTHVDPDLSEDEFNEFLESVKNANILKTLKTVLPSSDVLETSWLYGFADDWSSTTSKTSNFVGLKVKVPANKSVTVSDITMEFDGVQDITLYLYHTSKTTALQTKSVSTGLGNKVSVDWTLSTYDYPAGYFLIGYYVDDLSGVNAYTRKWNCSEIQHRYRFIGVESVYIPSADIDLPNIDDEVMTSDTFGLNPLFAVREDYTQTLLENVSRFDNLVMLFVAADLIERMKLSVRSDFYERQAARAVTELEGSKEFGITGLYSQIKIEAHKVYSDLFGKPAYFNGTLR